MKKIFRIIIKDIHKHIIAPFIIIVFFTISSFIAYKYLIDYNEALALLFSITLTYILYLLFKKLLKLF
ncbi:hypothetical protein DTG75_21970 [Salmonella enterica subsp. salamae]|uniref:Uncharacterized protein n=1 Tax=Salmonella enterica subsp. salamae serovar 55:k:z39 str. 1315K TaxID=1243602 RepID=A0A6C7C7C0_SALER|nr:hypothetical protein LFZ47_18795 [Salmonella enterica subsp. salamae serovar 55:k:z39 str. 1315K]ECG1251840.1 hypothetical protein [Salmonella enterica subsp. salamae]ECG1478877.1 hypothetical protein [Salmonella enterica subsp. salamae]MJZ05591.1 hypothetical protein [Salmonella enterica subsp. salamae]